MFTGNTYWKPRLASSKARYSDNNTSSSDNYDPFSGGIFWCVIGVGLIISIIGLAQGFLTPNFFTPGRNPMLEFEVNSLEVTSMTVYNNTNDYYSIVRDHKHISADLNFNLTLKNERDLLMYFYTMQVSLEYHNESLSSTMLEPFTLLEKQRELQFGMQINKDDANLQHEVVDSISRDLWGRNVLQFALKAQIHSLRWRRAPEKCSMSVFCDDIQVRFLPANNLTTGSMIVSPILCGCENHCYLS